MKKIYFLVLSVLIFQSIHGQNSISKLNNGGALLVRLQTNQHVIQYHLKKLELDQAKFVKKNQKIKNQKIIENFQENWSFCPVYFFIVMTSMKFKIIISIKYLKTMNLYY